VAGEIDAVGVVHDAIEDGVGVGWITDQIVPFIEGDLAGDDGGSPAVAFFEDFEKVVPCGASSGSSPQSSSHVELNVTRLMCTTQ
jgi:hypothetical protein